MWNDRVARRLGCDRVVGHVHAELDDDVGADAVEEGHHGHLPHKWLQNILVDAICPHGLECQVSKLVNSDACPPPMTHRRRETMQHEGVAE